MQDWIRFSRGADWTLHRDAGGAAVFPELRPGQPLLRVGGTHQHTARCEASQEPDQNQNQKYPQKWMGLNPWTLQLVDCQLQRIQNEWRFLSLCLFCTSVYLLPLNHIRCCGDVFYKLYNTMHLLTMLALMVHESFLQRVLLCQSFNILCLLLLCFSI